MTANLALSIRYVGSYSDGLDLSGLFNTAQTPGPGTPAQVNQRQPFPWISGTPFFGTDLLAEGRKHNALKLLRQIPSIGPIRAVLLLALIQTPHRFRSKRQLWAYSGLALETRNSGEYCMVRGQLKRSKKVVAIRGLNKNHNHDLKNIFKGAAIRAAAVDGPFQEFYAALLAKGMKSAMARLTLARKIAAITLIVWKKGVRFDAEHLKQQAA